MVQKIIEKILKGLANGVLKKQKPQIVTVTGSVGKTSTKEAIFCVLKTKFNVRRNIKNYNNELGVPLTIIGCESGGKNFFLWKWVIFKAFILSLFKNKSYPEILVLEIGADKPGDLEYLMEIFPKELLKAAVLTAVAPVHLEFFGTMENILNEKTVPFNYLPEDGKSIINKDCVKGYNKADIEYGLEQADNELFNQFVFPHQAYAPLAAIAVGKVFGVNELEAKKAIARDYQIQPGRGRKIKGINNSAIIDDTYNSSPISAIAAIEALAKMSAGRKIAVLGSMLELGGQSPQLHRQVGERAKALKIDYIITYGKEAEDFIGNNHFSEQKKLIEFLKNFIRPNDIILIKGSQGARMEKITKALMAHPERAKELLTRQNKQWLKK